MIEQGKFITFEGSEGSGKSTQSQLVHDYLKEQGHQVLQIREPGGIAISEDIRKILLDVKNDNMGQECETMLYMAARAQLVHERIQPELENGTIILCDRFLDSTIVYQGNGCGVDIDFIKQCGKFVTRDIEPDLTLLFDIDTEQGLSRTNAEKDRIELRSLEYHNKVRQGYLAIAKENPGRVKTITVDRGKEEIFEEVKQHIDALLVQNG